MRSTLAVLAIAAVSAIAAAPAAAKNRLVDDDKAQCPFAAYTTIQAAVDDARPRDSVRVCDGDYSESVFVAPEKQDLTLVAKSRPGVTIRPPADSFAVWVEEGARLTEISGFTIDGDGEASGIMLDGATAGDGGAIVERIHHNSMREVVSGIELGAFDARALDISRNTIRHQRFGIHVDSSTAYVRANRVIGTGAHAGIALGASSKGWVTGNYVQGNAFGISIGFTGNVVVGNNLVRGNGDGISVGHYGSDVVVRGNQVHDNTGFGLRVEGAGSAPAVLRDNDLRGNGGLDCFDDSTGSVSFGTANRWIANLGLDASPAGICKP